MNLQIIRLNKTDDFSISKGKTQARSFDFDTRIPLPYNPGMSSVYASHKLFITCIDDGKKSSGRTTFTETGGNNK
jgi:hypothetical protein